MSCASACKCNFPAYFQNFSHDKDKEIEQLIPLYPDFIIRYGVSGEEGQWNYDYCSVGWKFEKNGEKYGNWVDVDTDNLIAAHVQMMKEIQELSIKDRKGKD